MLMSSWKLVQAKFIWKQGLVYMLSFVLELSDGEKLPRAAMNFEQLMSPVQKSFEAVICFEAGYASCVLAVVPSTNGSTGAPCPFTWKGYICWHKVVTFGSE